MAGANDAPHPKKTDEQRASEPTQPSPRSGSCILWACNAFSLRGCNAFHRSIIVCKAPTVAFPSSRRYQHHATMMFVCFGRRCPIRHHGDRPLRLLRGDGPDTGQAARPPSIAFSKSPRKWKSRTSICAFRLAAASGAQAVAVLWCRLLVLPKHVMFSFYEYLCPVCARRALLVSIACRLQNGSRNRIPVCT